jgi:hypothetical protein
MHVICVFMCWQGGCIKSRYAFVCGRGRERVCVLGISCRAWHTNLSAAWYGLIASLATTLRPSLKNVGNRVLRSTWDSRIFVEGCALCVCGGGGGGSCVLARGVTYYWGQKPA